jgi:hypothetical protein
MKFPQDLSFRASMTLSIQKKVVKHIELYRLEVLQESLENEKCELTIRRGDQEPHIIQAFLDINSCADYLHTNGLDSQGWVPVEVEERGVGAVRNPWP